MLAIGRDGKAIGVVAILIRICVSYLEKDYYCNRANYVASCNCRECRSVSARLSKATTIASGAGEWRSKSLSAIWIIMALKRKRRDAKQGLFFPIPIKFQAPPKVSRKSFLQLKDYYFFLVLVFMVS